MLLVKWALRLLERAATRQEKDLRAARLFDDVTLCARILHRGIERASLPVGNRIIIYPPADAVDVALAGVRDALDRSAL